MWWGSLGCMQAKRRTHRQYLELKCYLDTRKQNSSELCFYLQFIFSWKYVRKHTAVEDKVGCTEVKIRAQPICHLVILLADIGQSYIYRYLHFSPTWAEVEGWGKNEGVLEGRARPSGWVEGKKQSACSSWSAHASIIIIIIIIILGGGVGLIQEETVFSVSTLRCFSHPRLTLAGPSNDARIQLGMHNNYRPNITKSDFYKLKKNRKFSKCDT